MRAKTNRAFIQWLQAWARREGVDAETLMSLMFLNALDVIDSTRTFRKHLDLAEEVLP